MKFKSKLSNIKIRGKKPNKHKNEVKNITNVYDAPDEVIKFYRDYWIMIFNARYDTENRKVLKILLSKQILQKFGIALAHLKIGSTSVNLLKEVHHVLHSFYHARNC